MSKTKLYRKRFIPNEIICLSNDIILHQDEKLVITKWVTLNPRIDIHHGISAYYIDLGYKVSKIYDKNNTLVYWYCDIIHTRMDKKMNEIIFEDLLVDVLVFENGKVQVLDLSELPEALDSNLITIDKLKDALRILDSLLRIIYQGNFSTLQAPVNNAELNYSSSSI